MYIQIRDNIAVEIIPDENPDFPGIPPEERYAPDFLAKCICVTAETPVEIGWIYDPATQAWWG